MKPIHDMTPEERLWAKKLTLLIVDAIDGPMEGLETCTSEPDLFGGREIKQGVTDFYSVEYEARRDAGDMIQSLHPTFVFCCDVLDADQYRIREMFIDGKLDRDGLMRYYTMLNKD